MGHRQHQQHQQPEESSSPGPSRQNAQHQRREQQQGTGTTSAPVEVELTMVDGNGDPVNCAEVLAAGPPTLGEATRAGAGGAGAGGETEAEAGETANGRDTNGSFDESVLLYQLCLQQRPGGAAANNGDSNELLLMDTEGSNAGNGNGNDKDDNPRNPGVIYADQDHNDSSSRGSPPTTAYLCTADQTTKNTRGKFLSYEYDVHLREPNHILDAGGEYEAKMVAYLARKLDVNDCAVDPLSQQMFGGGSGRNSNRARRYMRRRSLQQDGVGVGAGTVRGDADDTLPVVVGISSEPRDMPDYDAACNEHYLGIPTKCYHMNGSLALYFRPDAPDDVVEIQAQKVLRLISRGMSEDRFKTDSIPLAVFISGTVSGQQQGTDGAVSPDDEGGIGFTPTVVNEGGSGSDDGAGGGGSVFAPPPDSSSSIRGETGTDANGSGSGGGSSTSSSSSSSSAVAGIGAGIAVACLIVLALFVRRRKRQAQARKYSLRDVGANGIHPLDNSPEVKPDGVVITDMSKSHRKSNSNNFSDGTYGESTLPNELSGSFDDDGAYQEVVELGLTEEAAAATAAIAQAAAASAESNRHDAAAVAASKSAADTGRNHNRTSSKDSSYYTAADSNKSMERSRGSSTVGANNYGPNQGQQRRRSASNDNTNNNNVVYDEDDDISTGSEESGVTIELDLNRVNSTVSDITWAGPKNMQNASAAGNILNRFPPYKSLYSPTTEDVIAEEEDDCDASSPSSRSHGGSRTSGGGGSTEFGTPRPPPQRRI